MVRAERRPALDQAPRRLCRVDRVGRRDGSILEDATFAAGDDRLQETADAPFRRTSVDGAAEQALHAQDVAAWRVSRKPFAEELCGGIRASRIRMIFFRVRTRRGAVE